MGLLDFFVKGKPIYNPEILHNQQSVEFDDNQLNKSMEINPNKPLEEYQKLPPVIFGNG